MNQTSAPSFVVPVLPPAGTLNTEPTEPAAVPRCTTSFMMLTMIHASSGDITCAFTGRGSQRTAPFAFSTRTIAVGVDRTPRFAFAALVVILLFWFLFVVLL